ncbi:MAG: hypothetical protein HY075_11930 [Deltaproteobacteria bacterium]|nr:hypothetical protein [Deltaproteobacteria bacterium]
MRLLLWAAVVASVMTVVSLYAEAADDAARVAPKTVNRLPASNDSAPTVVEEQDAPLSSELAGASIEVGFSQDNEPEPHLLAVGGEGRVQLFQLGEVSPELDRRPASEAKDVPQGTAPKGMPPGVFARRMKQAVEVEKFFSARQPKPKRHCKDHYLVRIKMGDKFRERRGCTNQSNDPFAGFAQLFFRDAFVMWSR